MKGVLLTRENEIRKWSNQRRLIKCLNKVLHKYPTWKQVEIFQTQDEVECPVQRKRKRINEDITESKKEIKKEAILPVVEDRTLTQNSHITDQQGC